MNPRNIISLSSVAALAILSFGVFQLTETIAEETEKNGYKYAEGTSITAQFNFENGKSVIHPFEVFEQMHGFDLSDVATFKIEKVVGETPLLHEAADRAHKYSLNEQFYNGKYVDVDILIHQDANVLRHLSYNRCQITDYTVETLFDKEEAWMGKGFVLLDKFEFTCKGYEPNSPAFDEMMNNHKKGDTTSTMDLIEPEFTWEDHYKFQ